MSSRVVETVDRVLEELRAANVDPSAVTVTGEGDGVEIIIVPHRDLGGVSFVLWTDEKGTQLLWAGIGDLSTHDDIDLGVFVARIPHEGAWIETLHDALKSEFNRPIRLKQRRGALGGARVDCYVEVEQKKRRLASLRVKSASRPVGSAPQPLITSLASGPPLHFSISPPLENWRRYR